MKNDFVLRHSPAVRWTHWLTALSGIFLLFTGLGELPMYKRYNVLKVPGLHWAGDFELNLVLHYLGAFVFTAAVFFHLIYHLRRREFAAIPRRGDLGESLRIIAAILSGKKEPPHGKFLAEQRLAYAGIGGISLLLIVTGLIKAYKNLGAIVLVPAFLQTVTLVHTFATMVFLFLVATHLAAFALRSNWPLLPSMISGKVQRQYAEERHSKWKYPSE